MSTARIYLELSNEIQGVLADNGLNIQDILEKESIEATVTHGVPPYQSAEKARSKDVVTIIMAVSIAVPTIGFAISQVLNALYNKPYFIEYYENVELRDEKGKILVDKDGNPLFKIVKRHELLEPRKENHNNREFEANFNLVNGVVIKFSTKERGLNKIGNFLERIPCKLSV